MQLKAADEGAVTALLPLLVKEAEEAEDVHRAGVGDRLAAAVDGLLRETVRALSKLAQLRLPNPSPIPIPSPSPA